MSRTPHLYHWTHRSNLASIRRHGLDPSFCLGKKRCVWACVRAQVGWALGHVAARHGHMPDEFVLLEVRPLPSKLRRTKFAGVYTCTQGYSPDRIVSIRRGLLADPKPLIPARG